MITIKQIQNNANVTDGSNTITLGAGDSYTCSEPEEKLDFIIEVDTTLGDGGNDFQINFTSSSITNFSVKMGDGVEYNIYPNRTSPLIHTYSQSGVYNISFIGTSDFSFPTDEKLKITAIKQWGKLNFNSLNSLLSNASNLVSVPLSESLVLAQDSRSLFNNVPVDKYSNFVSYNTTNMSSMFRDSNFDDNLGYLNISRLTSAVNMFLGTSMSVANCDAIFIGWTRWTNGQANITLKSNVSIHMGTTDYTRGGAAEDAFNYFVNTLNWTITFS